MRDAILANIAATNPSWYVIEETDDEFRDFFLSPEFVSLGIEAPNGELAGCGVASYRRSELELFRSYISPQEFAIPGRVAYIELIQVALGYRGFGFQRVFFSELESILASNGARVLTSVVSPDNKYSLANFRRMGYEFVGEIILQKSGYRRLLAVKKIENS